MHASTACSLLTQVENQLCCFPFQEIRKAFGESYFIHTESSASTCPACWEVGIRKTINTRQGCGKQGGRQVSPREHPHTTNLLLQVELTSTFSLSNFENCINLENWMQLSITPRLITFMLIFLSRCQVRGKELQSVSCKPAKPNKNCMWISHSFHESLRPSLIGSKDLSLLSVQLLITSAHHQNTLWAFIVLDKLHWVPSSTINYNHFVAHFKTSSFDFINFLYSWL